MNRDDWMEFAQIAVFCAMLVISIVCLLILFP